MVCGDPLLPQEYHAINMLAVWWTIIDQHEVSLRMDVYFGFIGVMDFRDGQNTRIPIALREQQVIFVSGMRATYPAWSRHVDRTGSIVSDSL